MNSSIVDALGWTLIHSLWECAAIAVLSAAVGLTMKRATSNARYVAAYSSLLAMPFTSIATFLALFSSRHISAVVPALTGIAAAVPSAPVTPSNPLPQIQIPLPYMQILVWFWSAGVLAMSTWSVAGWLAAQRLKRRSKRSLPEFWQSRLAVLAIQLGIRRSIRLCESALAQVPAVIGWLRPVVLVPAGALLNLSARELEAVLAHELAHIRRFDYVANLLQSAIETLMFYHPAMWWLSKRIRAERENSCDDLAIEACGDRLVYARALTALEELRCGTPQFAMAATGGPLLSRIRRLLGKDDTRRRALPLWIALAAVLVAVLAVSSGIRLRAQDGSVPSPQSPDQPASAPVPAKARAPRARKPHAPSAAAASTAPQAPAQEAQTPEPAAPVTRFDDAALSKLRRQIAALEHERVTLAATYTTRRDVLQKLEAQLTALRKSEIEAAGEHAKDETAASTPREGYLAGLVDAGYTQISVDDIIALRDNGVEPKYIKGMLQAGFGTPSPKDLINLHNNGVSPELARKAVAAGIPKLTVERIIDLARNGVDLEAVRRIHALGFGPFSIEEIVDLQRNGVPADLFEALKESGYTKVDSHQAVTAQQNGLSARSLRNLREQGFKGLTFEQVIKLCRAGVI